MGKIHVLSQEIISRLRCGEVIHRPVNVVKELIENSLDSGAQQITVRIEQGGKKLIEVLDDGCGMSAEDAKLCLEPHATSKVFQIQDLDSIATLGFRGEALHSIATVGLVEIRTRGHDSDVGTVISNMGGKISAKPIGCNRGTSVNVKALFYNTPVRRTSLKNDAAETAAITRLVGRFILSRPEIEFSYSVNGSLHLVRRRTMSEESMVSTILGAEIARNAYRVDYDQNGVKISGFIGSPHVVKRTSDSIVLSINGRLVEDIQPFLRMIREGYLRTIQSHEYPVVVLRLFMDPSKIDPNVHPQKSVVNVLDQDLFRMAVYQTISSTQTRFRGSETLLNPVTPLSPSGGIVAPPDPHAQISDNFDAPQEGSLGKIDGYPEEIETPIPAKESSYPLPQLDVIGQFRKTYIIASSDQFLFLVDQHALHEKQLFEELMDRTEIEVVKLASPYVLHATPEDSDLLEASSELFSEYGLSIERLDSDTWKCYSIPTVRGDAIPEGEIIGLIRDSLKGIGEKPSLDEFRRRVYAEVACKSAIRANQTLTVSDMSRLLEKGRSMKDAFFCPHGRPAVKVYRQGTVDKWFKRS